MCRRHWRVGWRCRFFIVLPFRQQRGFFARHQAHAFFLLFELLAAQIIVFACRQRLHGRVITVADNGRPDEHQQVALHFGGALRFEQVAEQRNVAEQRHFRDAFLHVVINQSAEHDGVTVIDQHGVLDLAFVGDNIDAGGAGNRRHFLFDFQIDGAAFVDLRLDLEFDANFFALHLLERILVVVAQCRTGDHRHFLTDQQFGFLVVHGRHRRHRQHIRIGVGTEGANEGAETETVFLDPAQTDTDALHLAEHRRQRRAVVTVRGRGGGGDHATVVLRGGGAALAALQLRGAGDLANRRTGVVEAGKTHRFQITVLATAEQPLHAEFFRLVVGDLDDEGLQMHLRTPDVELADDIFQRTHHVRRRGDHQCVGVLVRFDAEVFVVAPGRGIGLLAFLLFRQLLRNTGQHFDHVFGFCIVQVQHLGIAAGRHRLIQLGDHGAQAQTGRTFGTDQQAVGAHIGGDARFVDLVFGFLALAIQGFQNAQDLFC